MTIRCPFCGCNPYHYEHNGLGLEPVAVVCCDLGVEFYSKEAPEPLIKLGGRIAKLMYGVSVIEKKIDDLRAEAEAMFEEPEDGEVAA